MRGLEQIIHFACLFRSEHSQRLQHVGLIEVITDSTDFAVHHSACNRILCSVRIRSVVAKTGGDMFVNPIVPVGRDKEFATRDLVKECRNLRVTPHVAQDYTRPGGSAIDNRTTRARGLRREPKKAEANRKMLRLIEDDRADAEAAPSRRVPKYANLPKL